VHSAGFLEIDRADVLLTVFDFGNSPSNWTKY